MIVFVGGTTYRHCAPRWIAEHTVGDDEILALWKQGKDTYEIAVALAMPEHQVDRQLHAARDRRLLTSSSSTSELNEAAG